MQKLETNSKVKSKKIFIIVIALLLVSCAIYCNKENITGLFYNKTILANGQIVQESKNNIVSSDPEALAEEPYQIEKEPSHYAEEIMHFAKHSPNYRNYLLGVNLLVINFLQDKDYTKQICQIEAIQLPQEIKDILIDFHKYNTEYLIKPSSIKIRIFPKDSWWIEKFIKIERKSNLTNDKEKLRSKIIENLEYFINFVYSEKLQQEFIEEKYK